MKKLPFLALPILLLACSDHSAPTGFKAVEPAQMDSSRTGCPELIGSYLLGSVVEENPVLADWLGGASKGMTFWVFDSLVGSNAYNMRIQAQRQNFLAAAKQLQQAKPTDYYQWRTQLAKALKDNKESDRDLVQQIAQIGPVFRFKAQVHGYACGDGWMKIMEAEKRVEEDADSYISQQDLWVARDELGNLLFRTDIYRQKPGWTFWAAGGAGVRLIKTGQLWHKMQKAPDNLQPIDWDEKELPLGEPTHASVMCKKNVAAFVDFNQQLFAHMPAGVFLEKFIPLDNNPAAPCSQQRLQVAIGATSLALAEEFLNKIRQMGAVRALEIIETRMGERDKVQLLLEITAAFQLN